MIETEDEVINAEIYFEQQKIDDTSSKDFLTLLNSIKSKLEANRPIKEIKKMIYDSDINSDMQDTLQSMANEQVSNITGDDENVSLTEEAFAGYTFKESIKLRKEATQKRAISFMARAKEILKDGKSVQKIIDEEMTKYKREIESFYRTQMKSVREYGYAKVDKKNSKEVKGWISIAILDNKTSAICMALHNKFYSADDYKNRFEIPNKPPRHPNCRSILMTVYKGKSIQSYKGKNLETFLEQNPNTGKELMGIEKYRLFKEKKVKLTNFVDLKGKRFYTNSEIKKRLNIK